MTRAPDEPVEIKSPIEAEVKTPEAKVPEPKSEIKTKAELAKEAAAKKAEEIKAERERADHEKEIKAEAKKADREKEAKAEAKKSEREKKTEAKREPVSSGAGKAGPGTYLQVAAVGKPEADLVSEVLGKKGFKAYVLAVEGKPDLYRVVVGPVKAGAEQSRTMDDLKSAGFKPFPRKI